MSRGISLSRQAAACQVLRSTGICTHNSLMQIGEQAAAPPSELPLRPQDEVECRRCDVHCDKVVFPGACLERGCPFSYSHEEFGHTYMGCLMKVFDVEIDVDLLEEAESRRGGFGAVRATGPALPMCKVAVEACYEARAGELGCVNPEFHDLPVGEPSFRIFAQIAS
jgi:hypothetical protein